MQTGFHGSKRISIRFNQTISGILEKTGSGGESAFTLKFSARGAEHPDDGLELIGTITIEGIASERPLIGTLASDGGLRKLSFAFSDDELTEHRFEGLLRGTGIFKRAALDQGSLFGAEDDEPMAEVRRSVTGPPLAALASFRVQLRKRRPVFKDRRSRMQKRNSHPLPFRKTAISLAEAALPPGAALEGGGEHTIKRVEGSILTKVGAARRVIGAGLFGIEWLAKMSTGKKFSQLSYEDREAWLDKTNASRSIVLKPFKPLFFITLTVLKYFHINTEKSHQALGTEARLPLVEGMSVGASHSESFAPEPDPPWRSQVIESESFDCDEVVEADAVVVGTGAGGGPVAQELAERGFTVAIVEEGRFYRREESKAGSQHSAMAFGNGVIIHPMGRAVGGATFVNAGTCFRTPPDVLMDWVKMGMPEFHPDKMAPYFDQVEEIIQVTESDPKYVGPVGEVIRRGCDKLGYHSMNLRRNAPSCEGQALCSQGCPHGAKQSTEKAYIPRALKSKASLFTGFKVKQILTDGVRAIGVQAYGKGKDGKATRLTVFARAVVLAAGSLITPTIIQRNNLVRGNKWVGANLSFQPASAAVGIIPGVEIRSHQCIPQAYGIDEFQQAGIMFENGHIPLVAWAVMQRGVGRKYVEMVERFPNVANFGFVVKDTTRGRVRPGVGGRPFITYWMNKPDLNKVVKAMAIISRVFFASGADRVIPATVSGYQMTDEEDVKRFESKKWKPRDFILAAFHAVGTARVGPDPSMSAIDLNHQCHAVPGLFVADGSAVPGPPGVNTQVTIMAVATRAAERIAAALER